MCRRFFIVNPIQQYLSGLTPKERAKYFKEYNAQRLRWPYQMVQIDLPADLPNEQKSILGQWRSRFHLATVWNRSDQLSIVVHRTDMDEQGNWKSGITLEDLVAIQAACGYGGMVGILPLGEFPGNMYTIFLKHAKTVEA